MRIIKRKTLVDFWTVYTDSEQALKTWFHEAKESLWKSPADVKKHYRNASILKKGRVVFNICGNKYRLVVKINYKASIILIRFIGTHKSYNIINAEEI